MLHELATTFSPAFWWLLGVATGWCIFGAMHAGECARHWEQGFVDGRKLERRRGES